MVQLELFSYDIGIDEKVEKKRLVDKVKEWIIHTETMPEDENCDYADPYGSFFGVGIGEECREMSREEFKDIYNEEVTWLGRWTLV